LRHHYIAGKEKLIPLICMMSDTIVLSLLFAALFASAGVRAQDKKIDTTAIQGAEGYRVVCNNKSASANQISISPKGFGKDVRDLSFTVKGTLRKILVDDFNGDGYPDLVLCIYSGMNGE
jgi:hypothetical protein